LPEMRLEGAASYYCRSVFVPTLKKMRRHLKIVGKNISDCP